MLSNLPKLDQGQADFANLLAAVPDLQTRALAWIAPASEALTKVLNMSCSLEFGRVSTGQALEASGSLLAATWPPQAGNFYVEFDTKLLQTAVYKSIGQTRPENLGPELSDLERGVAMYLLARVFEGSKESFQLSKSQCVLQSPMLCLSLAFKAGDQNSFLRVWVSSELVKSLTALNGPSAEQATELGKERTESVTIPMRVNLTSVELTQSDLADLEAGDIIVLEGVSIPGPAKAFLDQEPRQDFEGQLSKNESGQYTFTI